MSLFQYTKHVSISFNPSNMATTIGRLMPSRNPADEANERFTFKTDNVGTQYALVNELTPRRVKSILNAAEYSGDLGPLYALYDRMETTDTRYGGLVGQVKAAIGGFRHKVQPAETTSEEEQRIAEDYAAVARYIMSVLDTQATTKLFAQPYFFGSKLYRIRWELEPFAYGRSMWIPHEVAPVKGEAMKSSLEKKGERYGSMMVRTDTSADGRYVSDLPSGSALFLEVEYGRDRYDKIGKARQCLPWYLGVQFVQSWWIQYIEGYGSPLRIGRVPRGLNPKERMDMERFLQVLGQHGYALFPNDMEVQLLEANRQGTITTYGDFIQKAHEEYAVALLGQAATVGTKGNSAPYAGAVVANSIRYEIMQDVAGLIRNGWKKLLDMVLSINYGDQYERRLAPTITPVLITPTEMSTKADTAVKAQTNGVPVHVDYWFEQVLGIEPPREGEVVVMYGKQFRYGIDPMPEAPQSGATGEGADRGERSVATDGNDEYGDTTAS